MMTENLKSHTLLYFMHQVFKHENRFARLYDHQQVSGDYENPADQSTDDIDRLQSAFEQKLTLNENVPLRILDTDMNRYSRNV